MSVIGDRSYENNLLPTFNFHTLRKDINMRFSIPVDEMTTEDKLAAMEQLWDNLCRSPESIPSPDWHEDVLSSREILVKEGKATFSSLSDVKDRIRRDTK